MKYGTERNQSDMGASICGQTREKVMRDETNNILDTHSAGAAPAESLAHHIVRSSGLHLESPMACKYCHAL
jgi:hypothetical protein